MNLTGQLLISMPSLNDERFFKTVIYLCAHSKDGAMGIIINKKIDYDLYPDLLQQLGIDKPLGNKKLFIRYGGPVESGRGFILHSDEIMQKDTLSIEKGVALTSTAEFFEDLSEGKGPRNSILALGYAGWSPGQLENEILSNSWMTLQTDSSFLFDDEVSNKWLNAYKLLGIDPNKLSYQSGRA
tara:strand:+ start:364 stop:915 length:552 start_codon:yes stop_codon:yes gene_type:complete